MVHTTVNMTTDFYDFLFTDYRDSMEISSTELVRMIMHFVSQEMSQRIRPEGPVKYQMNPFDNEWVVVHLYLTEEEYDHFVDMRNFFKMSVAHLIRYGLIRYCNQINKLFDIWQDKNLFPEYSFGQVTVSGRQFFIIGWRKTTKYKELTTFT